LTKTDIDGIIMHARSPSGWAPLKRIYTYIFWAVLPTRAHLGLNFHNFRQPLFKD
jgi:hypothetical protein